MNAKNIKRLPYGNSNFERIIAENYAYVDKTQYIEMLEKESNSNPVAADYHAKRPALPHVVYPKTRWYLGTFGLTLKDSHSSRIAATVIGDAGRAAQPTRSHRPN